MKKITSCILLIITFALTACGSNGNGEDGYIPVAADYAANENNGDAEDYQPSGEESPAVYQPDGEGEEEFEEQYNPHFEPQQYPIHGFALMYRGVPIQMNQDMDYLLPQLGEPSGVFEAPSCAFDGIDRIFGFPGVQIHTYPDGDLDRVHTVNFMSDSITTNNGIRLGSSWADVVAAYGNDYEQDITMFTYTLGQTTLSFFVEGDTVTGIIFGLIMG